MGWGKDASLGGSPGKERGEGGELVDEGKQAKLALEIL